MATEIIVIVENENARGRSSLLAVEISGRQAADAPTHDDEVIILAGVDRLPCLIPKCAITQRVSDFEGTGVTASHSGASRRIVARSILRSRAACFGRE